MRAWCIPFLCRRRRCFWTLFYRPNETCAAAAHIRKSQKHTSPHVCICFATHTQLWSPPSSTAHHRTDMAVFTLAYRACARVETKTARIQILYIWGWTARDTS